MPPGLATTCAGDATWRCLIGGFRGILDHARWGGYKDLRLSGGFRMDPRPFALGRAAVFRLNVPAILLLTTRAGVNIWRCLIGGFRGILDHARWAGHLDVLDRRISGHSRLCALGWAAVFRLNVPTILLLTMRAGLDTWMCLTGGFRGTLGCACWGGKDFGGGSGVFTVTGYSRAPPGYGFHFGSGASISRVAAPKRPSDCPSTSPIMSSRCFPRAKAVGEDKHRR